MNAEVAAATDRPEQVLVPIGARSADLAVRRDDVDGDEVVRREPELPAEIWP